MSEELDIENDKQIEPDALDVEFLNHQNLFYKYSAALNDAIDQRNELKIQVEETKEALEKVKAELDQQIREDPEEYDLQKVTEATVNAAITTTERYQQALQHYFDKRRELNQAQSEVNRHFTDTQTMDNRKSSLENLVRLLNQQYFASPSEPRNISEEYHKRVAKNKKGAKEKVKQEKRRRKKDD